jgi:hypothetical protein
MTLSLTKAIATGRLQEFIAQEEGREIVKLKLDKAIAALIKRPQSEDQTSHSASAANSSGK